MCLTMLFALAATASANMVLTCTTLACTLAGPTSKLAVTQASQLTEGLRALIRDSYACRHCHRLAYKSQRETQDDLATRRADKLRDRLGWHAGILNGAGSKPNGIHWQTFRRMQASHDAHVMRALASMRAKLGLTMTRLDCINSVW
jgi:hypothetical protein